MKNWENFTTWINSLLEKSQYGLHKKKPCLTNLSEFFKQDLKFFLPNKVHPFILIYLNFQKDFNQRIFPYQKLRAFLRKLRKKK